MGVQTLKDAFKESSFKFAEKTAVSFLRDGAIETELSYRELDEDSNRMAQTFQAMGVKKGDRVILYLEKSLVFVIAHLALQKIGAISVPLNPGFKKSEMSYLMHDAEASLLLAGPDQESIAKEIMPSLKVIVIDTQKPYQETTFFRNASAETPRVDILPDDTGLIIYTSGTTGKPKGAMLTQRNLLHDAMNIIKIWDISEKDVLCHALPLFHVHGLCFALHTSLAAGAHVMMHHAFSVERVIHSLSQKEGPYVCSVFMAVPSMYGKMMDIMSGKSMDFSHMRLWTSGSAPLLAKDFGRVRDTFGKEPVEREGMTETGMNFSNPLKGKRKPGSIGIPLPELEVRVVDSESHKDVQPGETGEFWLKGAGISPGYWQKPEETAKTFEKDWFRTGDLGRVDGEGYYYLTDRIKHIIISGGENISPKEIETVINQFDDVVESSVVGIPDEKWGEKVVAAVVTKPDAALKTEALRKACKEKLHDWKCPKAFLFVEALPKNTMGKVLKEEVKALFNDEGA